MLLTPLLSARTVHVPPTSIASSYQIHGDHQLILNSNYNKKNSEDNQNSTSSGSSSSRNSIGRGSISESGKKYLEFWNYKRDYSLAAIARAATVYDMLNISNSTTAIHTIPRRKKQNYQNSNYNSKYENNSNVKVRTTSIPETVLHYEKHSLSSVHNITKIRNNLSYQNKEKNSEITGVVTFKQNLIKNSSTNSNIVHSNNNSSVNYFSEKKPHQLVHSDKTKDNSLFLVKTNLDKNINYGNPVESTIHGNGKKIQFTFHDFLFTAITFTLVGVLILSLIGVVRCLRATREATGALALPTPVLSEDRTPLNTESNNTVPMLSVQSPSCAGMERLGVPARSSFGSPTVRDNSDCFRSHISCRLRSDTNVLQPRDLTVSVMSGRQTKSYQNLNYPNNDMMSNCPHHVPLSDGEWGPDRNLQIKTPYQTEITRTFIKPPPNKTAYDIPEQSYNLYTSSSSSLSSTCNLSSQRSSTSIAQSTTATQHHNQQQIHKSKTNPLTKFLQRISNSKSPETTSNNLQQQIGSSLSGNGVSVGGGVVHQHHHHHQQHHHQQQLTQTTLMQQQHHHQQHQLNLSHNKNGNLHNFSISSTTSLHPQPIQIGTGGAGSGDASNGSTTSGSSGSPSSQISDSNLNSNSQTGS